MFVLADIIKIVRTVFWGGQCIIILYIERFEFMLVSKMVALQEIITITKERQ